MPKIKRQRTDHANKKIEELAPNISEMDGTTLTSNQGAAINDTNNTLKAGERGPSLLEDFLMREKITHFDHERIPERAVHARGVAAHGYFQAYKPVPHLTKAGFLNDPARKTPVFLRFSTVAGSRGSSDLARDVRGFAIKFYTDEGIFDMVGNNIPVFFIQDAIKFPDLIHAVKPEPHNEIPQAQSAHDTFYDFISLSPESFHMLMWVMSDRAIPRSLRMMEGFGIHTFRFIDAQGKSRFVKFHFKPALGMHSVLWDEALKINGKDPDFHRRDLWDAIEAGEFPEWEFGVQVVEEKDEHKFDFDLLDPTKIIPEEVVPITPLGRLVLNRNPDNYFAETEQVAFHPGHLVPGIDFSNDPLLQGRLFSYTDTQLTRLGGPNFAQIPINRPTCPMHNNQRDGHMQQIVNRGETSYFPNTISRGCPMQAKEDSGGFVSYAEKMQGAKVRGKTDKFFDHFSQAALFFNSQAPHEQQHIINALTFELGMVTRPAIVERMLGMLNKVDKNLASGIAQGLGMKSAGRRPGPGQPGRRRRRGKGDRTEADEKHLRKIARTEHDEHGQEHDPDPEGRHPRRRRRGRQRSLQHEGRPNERRRHGESHRAAGRDVAERARGGGQGRHQPVERGFGSFRCHLCPRRTEKRRDPRWRRSRDSVRERDLQTLQGAGRNRPGRGSAPSVRHRPGRGEERSGPDPRREGRREESLEQVHQGDRAASELGSGKDREHSSLMLPKSATLLRRAGSSAGISADWRGAR